MRRSISLIPLLFLYLGILAQETGSVSGTIKDEQTKGVVSGATVMIKGNVGTTTTNNNGRFTFPKLNAGNYDLVISHVGYETVEVPAVVNSGQTTVINKSLNADTRVGSEVVVSASRRPEKITSAPAFIQVIGAKDLARFAGSNVNEVVSRVAGVEYTRSGVDDITFNARGLHSTFNIKMFQLVDGRNTMSAASGSLPLFNNGSTQKDDIERIEIVLGPQTALYGPNAHNGLFNYITKDPRRYPGTTVSVSAGSQNQFSSRLRHAAVINHKWAYKLTGEHVTGEDYNWYDSVYAGGGVFGPPVVIPERIHDFTFKRYRGEAHIYYRVLPKADIIVSGGGSQFSRIQVVTGGRNHLKDVTYNFLQARFVHPRLFVTLYNTWGNMGNSIGIGNTTRDFWNMTHKPNPMTPEEAEVYASRYGNRFKEKSQRLNAEAQYNYSFPNAGLSLVSGISYQKEKPNGYGINLIDSFQKITVTQYGAVLQIEKQLPWTLRIVGATRFDHHSNFGDFIAPRLAILKSVGDGNIRFTWGRAYSMPSILNQYTGINRFLFGNGAGIKYIPTGTKYSSPASIRFTKSLTPEEVNTWEVGYKGRPVKNLFVDVNYHNGLSKNFISPTITVQGRALEVNGIPVTHNPVFAGRVTNDTLRNASFITFFNYGDVRTYGLDASMSYQFSKLIGVTVNYSWLDSDLSRNDIKNDANKDEFVSPEETSLNTPRHRCAVIVNLQNLWKDKLSFSIAARSVQQYDFYSGNQIGTAAGKGKRGEIPRPGKDPLLKNFDWGPLGGFTTVDLNVGYQVNEQCLVNLGVTNLFNTEQIEFVGSPSIGRLIMAEFKIHFPGKEK